MSAAHRAISIRQVVPPPRPLHLAIGMFDGVHLGHQAVIEAAIHSARQGGGVAAVLTFHPHPSRLFRPEAATQLLMPLEQKQKFLRAFGVDFVITQPFTRVFARLPAEKFLAYLKKHLPSLAAVYVGENFRFGQGRKGDVELLVRSGQAIGVAVVSVARLRHNGRPISSTRIRELLAQGDVSAASRLLGYTYYCDGQIQPGRHLGRKIGFPTLNLAWTPETQPAYGVYAVRLRADPAGKWLPGVANYGVRPTVETKAVSPLLETHLLNAGKVFRPGMKVRVEWLKFLRPEKKFFSLEALKRQIARDCAAAKKILRKEAKHTRN